MLPRRHTSICFQKLADPAPDLPLKYDNWHFGIVQIRRFYIRHQEYYSGLQKTRCNDLLPSRIFLQWRLQGYNRQAVLVSGGFWQ